MSDKSNLYFFTAFGLTALAFALILKPFAGALLLAFAFAILFKPLYRRLGQVTGRFKSLAASLTIVVVLVVVIAPAALLGWGAFREVHDLYDVYLIDQFSSPNDIAILTDQFQDYLNNFSITNLVNLEKIKTESANWLFSQIAPLFGGIAKTALATIIFFLSLFFLLRDSAYFRERLRELSPLKPDETDTVINKLSLAVTSIVRGSLLVAIIQGILTSIGFTIFDVPKPLLWGLVAAVAALIPGIGTALVLTPAIIYLYFTVGTGQAVGLLIWGVIAVGLIDNILGPILVGRGIKIHPLLILLSVLGGLVFFGPVGFLAGPLVLALLFALIPIYRSKID